MSDLDLQIIVDVLLPVCEVHTCVLDAILRQSLFNVLSYKLFTVF